MPLTYAPYAQKLLNGVFAVYKRRSTAIFSLLQEIRHRLEEDLNAMEQRPQKKMVVFKPVGQVLQNKCTPSGTQSSQHQLRLSHSDDVPVLETDWFDHPLVQGPRYMEDDIELHLGHTIDEHASGIQVIGIGHKGKEMVKQLGYLSLPGHYRATGQFGMSSLSHSTHTKIVERSTWDHVTKDKIDRILTYMQGLHRNECILASGVDLSSQRAYDLASQGLLKPKTPTNPIILDLKLVSFELPHFAIEATCSYESCLYVRRIIHEIGSELRSSAVCTHVQRMSDGVFTHSDPHTLLGHQINCNSVIESMKHFQLLLDQGVMKERKHFHSTNLVIDKSEQFISLPAKSNKNSSAEIHYDFDETVNKKTNQQQEIST